MTSRGLPLAARLNAACQCIWVDRDKLAVRLQQQLGATGPALPEGLVSGSVVFVEAKHVQAMDRTIELITRVVRSAAFEERIVSAAPAIARAPQPTTGGVLGFDFHLGAPEPQLIEINTNPGGLLVSLELARAATAYCDCLTEPLAVMSAAAVPLAAFEERVVEGFRAEFGRARGPTPLRTIAIVDDTPAGQYLLPEFMLYRRLLEQAGHRVLIADAADARIEGNVVTVGGETVDLVYNRCTDFYFEEERHAALREAYQRCLAVLTPHPAAHARWADKRVLAWLRDESLLRLAGLSDAEMAHLSATIPHTEVVETAHGADLWARRKGLFFKPADGFGGKAAYRGDKLTRKAFEHVLAHRYVAQVVAPTSTRRVPLEEGEEADLRVDVRNFAAGGETWLRAARLYRGQTTNFRTAGGGFAPVLTVPDSLVTNH